MPMRFVDRAKSTTTSVIPGAIVLDTTPINGFSLVQNALQIGDTVDIAVVHSNGSEYFVGRYTYTADNTLGNAIEISSNIAGNFSNGLKEVFITASSASLGPAPFIRSQPTASASTAVTTIASLPLQYRVRPGDQFNFFASLRVVNTTTASNLVVSLTFDTTNVLTLTQAIGATAAAAPGAAVIINGTLTFVSTNQAEASIHAIKQAAVAFNAVTNTSAPFTLPTSIESPTRTLGINVNTSAASSTFICRQASIRRVK